jgi:hypothetical protein
MTLNWNSIVQGVTVGIAASVVLAIFGLLRHTVKDWIFRCRLRREFRFRSCGHNLDGITVGIQNQLGKKFTIRHLVMTADIGDCALNPTGEVSSSFKEQGPKFTRKQIRALKKGEIKELPGRTEFQMRSWRAMPTVEGFVTVEPFTSHQFVVLYQLIADHDVKPSGLRITIEYEAWPDKRRIMEIVTMEAAKELQQMVESGRKQILDGSLNIIRQKFGKPPIRIKKADPPG